MEKTLKTDSGQSISAWMATTPVAPESPLDQNTNADVCVIGAGIAGLSTAYLLAKEGQSVVVLDDGPAGRGMTARTTAHLSNAVDDRYFEIERLHGEEGAHLAANSHTTAIDQVEQIVKQEQIACDFERLDGYLFVPPRQSRKLLDDELAAAHRAGLSDVEKVARAPLSSYDTGPALRFPKQAQFHPLKYLTGMLEAIKRMGGRLYVPAHASEITGGKRGRVKTSGGFAVAGKAR